MEGKTIKEKILIPILITILSITIVSAHFAVLAINIVSYAAENEADGNNVDFLAYFEDENGEKVRNIEKAINANDITLCMEIGVKNEGYLNGQIELPNSNFKFKHSKGTSEGIDEITDDVIKLKQLNENESLNIKVGLELKEGADFNFATFNKDATVALKGKYVNARQKEKDIQIEEGIKIVLTNPYSDEESVNLTTEIVTNKIYDINGENKRVVQYLVKSGLTNDGYPIKQTSLQVKVPAGAEKIDVLDRGTIATNGRRERENNDDTLKITTNNNTVDIQIFNPEIDGKINYGRQRTDNFIISCVYDEEEKFEDNEIKTESIVKLYDESETVFNKEASINIDEEKDGIVGYEIVGQSKIYKGKMYAKEKESFKTATIVDVRFPEAEKNIKIVEGNSNYKTVIEGQEYVVNANTVYKKSTINKEQLLNILGENGELVVKKTDGTEIKKVTKETIDEEENVTVAYEDGQREIVIEINNANNTGTLEIVHDKRILPEEGIDRNVMKVLAQLVTEGYVEQTENINKNEVKSEITLEDSKTSASLELSTKQLIAGTVNENVELKVTLKNNNSKYDLYKNPKFEIELPEDVEEVVLNSVNILYGDELSKQVEDVYVNDQGRKVIRFEFVGEQTKHNKEKLTTGTNIIINANIKVKAFEESKKDRFTLRYSNDQDVVYANDGVSEKTIEYIIPEASKRQVEEQENNTEFANLQELGEPAEQTAPITLTKTISAGNGNDIYERQVQKYTIKVKNNTNQDISNIKVNDTIPDELIYVTPIVRKKFQNEYSDTGYHNNDSDLDESSDMEDTYLMHPPVAEEIETLGANEEIDLYYYVRAKKDDANIDKTVGTKATATIGEDSTVYESNEISNTIKSSKLQIEVVSLKNKVATYLGGYQIPFRISVKNITNDTLNNIDVKTTLPDGLNFVKSERMIYNSEYNFYNLNENESYETPQADYNSTTRDVTWSIDRLEPDKEEVYYLEVELQELALDVKDENIIIETLAKINNDEEFKSNQEVILQSSRPRCTVRLETNLEDKYIEEEQEIEYIATIKNTGFNAIEMLDVNDELPDGITGKRITYINDGKETNYDVVKSANGSIDINPNEEVVVKIIASADKLADGVEELEVKNKVMIYSVELGTVNSNEVTNIVRKASKPSEGDEPGGDTPSDEPGENPSDNPSDNPGDEGGEQGGSQEQNSDRHSISGYVWLDENRDGARDSSENTMQGVRVELYDESGEEVVGESSSQNNGRYEISDLKNGKYTAVFYFDSKLYDVTDYKKSGVSEENNSDATRAELDDGLVAITDEITVRNEDVEYINLGLVNSSKFDLRLDKYINSVTVQSSGAVKKYSYSNANFAKIEVNRKTVNDTTITIEYKINVTNEGETAGYAKEIIDYKEKTLNFNESLNNGWELEGDQLINDSLSDELIRPGETKTLTLYLTKKLDENNLGTVTNTAEIGKDYNHNLLDDIDSTPGNKKSGEDDMSTVSLIIGIGTGRAIIYTSLIIATVAMLGAGIYLINKKVLKS